MVRFVVRKGADEMYQINDMVLYGVEGVCKITGKMVRRFGKEPVEYYVLESCDQHTTTYVPTDNEALVSKMRRLLSADEINKIIEGMPSEETIWIEDSSARATRYAEILAGEDRREIVRLIKTLYLHKQSLKEQKRKMHISDERFLRDAEKRLYEEFGQVLGIGSDQVLAHIVQLIGVEAEQ